MRISLLKCRGWAVVVGVVVALTALPVTGIRVSRADAAGLTPKSVPVQVRLAEEMAANEDWDETVRRWIEVLHYFGPSD